MKPGITAFVVFTTGAEKLDRCIGSLKSSVEEIVAVDTGAKDGARAIAEGHGCRVYDYPWSDSFAEAYNFAIDQVETEWTLWLDSDEWLEPEGGAALATAVSDKGAFAFNVIRRDFYSADSWSEMLQLRLWRTHEKMRLRGHIHAHFPAIALKLSSYGRHLKQSEIRILHDGFLGGVSKERTARNVAYLERELRERPGQLYYEIALAESLVQLEDPRGLQLVREIVSRFVHSREPAPPEPLLAVAFGLALRNVQQEEQYSPTTDQLIRLAWHWFGRSPIVVASIAMAELNRNSIFRGYHALLELSELQRTEHDRYVSFDPNIMGSPVSEALSRAAALLGKKDPALAN